MADIFFEDLIPGAVSTYGGHRVDRDEMVAFAHEFDAQPFHVDEAAARASPVGELIASGWYTCGVQMRMLCDAWLLRADGRGGLGLDEAKWLRPVRAGDVLRVRQTILETRGSASRPGLGIVRFRFETLNQRDEPVLSQIQSAMFGRRGAPPEPPGTSRAARAADPAPEAGGGAAPASRFFRDFDDVEVGVTTPLGAVRFTAEAIVAFARRFDPQPFHLSEAAAAAGPFGTLVASGWHTAAAWMSGLVAHRQAAVAAAAAAGAPPPRFGVSPGFTDLRWLRPVRAGDTVRFDTTAVETRPSRTRPGWGLVVSRNTGVNEAGETVFVFTGTGFWGRR